jgi:hypothetical protein
MKFFSDKKYGDRLGALTAALEWRDQTERELGKPRSEEPVISPTPTSTAASRTLEPNQALILLAPRPTGAQWLCPPL